MMEWIAGLEIIIYMTAILITVAVGVYRILSQAAGFIWAIILYMIAKAAE